MSEDAGGGDGDGEAMKEERNASSKGDESPGASPSTSSFASSVMRGLIDGMGNGKPVVVASPKQCQSRREEIVLEGGEMMERWWDERKYWMEDGCRVCVGSANEGSEGVPLCCRAGRERGRVVHHLGRPGSQLIGISMTPLSSTPSTQQIFHLT